MSSVRVACHPRLGILVCTDGHIMMPAKSGALARWTLGYVRRDGYMAVNIASRMYLIHRLVVETFIGSIPRGLEIDHIDRVKSNNHLENLRLVSHSENCRNRRTSDECRERFGVNFYEDPRLYLQRQIRDWRAKNREHDLERQQAYCKEYYRQNSERLRAKARENYHKRRAAKTAGIIGDKNVQKAS